MALTSTALKAVVTTAATMFADTVTEFQVFDKNIYMSKTLDSGIIPAAKGGSCDCHIVGQLITAPKELIKDAVAACIPLLKAAGDLPKLVLTPIPRYVKAKCCDRPTHITNFSEPNYRGKMASQLYITGRHQRGINVDGQSEDNKCPNS